MCKEKHYNHSWCSHASCSPEETSIHHHAPIASSIIKPGKSLQCSFKSTISVSFDEISYILGEYNILVDPNIPLVQDGRHRVPIDVKEETEAQK